MTPCVRHVAVTDKEIQMNALNLVYNWVTLTQ